MGYSDLDHLNHWCISKPELEQKKANPYTQNVSDTEKYTFPQRSVIKQIYELSVSIAFSPMFCFVKTAQQW